MSKSIIEAANKEAVSCLNLAEDVAKRFPVDTDKQTLNYAKWMLAAYIGRDAIERLAGEANVPNETARKALDAAFKRNNLVK